MPVEVAESSKSGLKAIRSKADRLTEALEKGLKMPWRGLRPDLVLHKGAGSSFSDESGYVLEDPVRGEHFELGDAEARLFLCLVTERDLKAAVKKLLTTTSLRPSAEDLLSFLKMLQKEKLAILPAEAAMESADIRSKKKSFIGLTIFKSYLFFRIPLLRPNRVLDILYPWVRPFWSPPFLFLYGVMGLAGLVFLSQQWELYIHSVNFLFTPRGALTFFFCLSLVKILHEFGHALAARHYNLFVRRMGIAFMVFMPILYTDVTEAWKMPSRKARLIIGAGGILVELVIAAVSLFFWSVLPDGMLRSMMFYFSGVSLVSTVFMNLNPLMRFDGYYILMDYLGVSNLRKRSLAMFKYHWRRAVVDWQGEKPEEHPWEQGLSIFGLFTLIYRFVLFFSIGIIVYQTLPKVIGVMHIVVAIGLFHIVPFFLEVFTILRSRKKWGRPLRVAFSCMVLACLIGGMAIPVSRAEKLHGLFLYGDVSVLKSPGRGRIATELPEIGTNVERGEILARIQDDQLERELETSLYDLEKVRENLKNLPSGGREGGYRKWLLAEEERLEKAVEKTRQKIATLEIASPVAGTVLDVSQYLEAGAYVSRDTFLLTVGSQRSLEIRAYAGESMYRNLRGKQIDTAEVVFRDLETSTVDAQFVELYDFPVVQFPNEALFDYAGGPFLSNPMPSGGVRSKLPQYPLIFTIRDGIRLPHGAPCIVKVKGKPTSVLGSTARLVTKALAAEGFL